jgi:hypothetical protein
MFETPAPSSVGRVAHADLALNEQPALTALALLLAYDKAGMVHE